MLKSKPITDSSSSSSSGVSDNLMQTDTNQLGADGSMPITIEGELVDAVRNQGDFVITTPMVALLVETKNPES